MAEKTIYKGRFGNIDKIGKFDEYLDSIKGCRKVDKIIYKQGRDSFDFLYNNIYYFDLDNVTLFAKFAVPETVHFRESNAGKIDTEIKLYGLEKSINDFEKKIKEEVDKFNIEDIVQVGVK